MRITQSISLSNIKTLSCYREGPPLGGEKPAGSVSRDRTACFQIGVTTKVGGDLETANEVWWS